MNPTDMSRFLTERVLHYPFSMIDRALMTHEFIPLVKSIFSNDLRPFKIKC